ncbi:MAG: ATP-binding protein [Rhodoferax sp.]|nr:ATP-binding protein [Rhodoferax sp.]
MPTFNAAGPSVPGQHYMIDPLNRIDLAEIESLIAGQRYFVLHAPRQTGKTTALLALMHHLNAQGTYRALYANIENAQAVRGDLERGMVIITRAIAQAASLYLKDQRLGDWLGQEGERTPAGDRLSSLLTYWAQVSDQPVVLFLDEVDALVGDTLISLLRQIRTGYTQRPDAFPQAMILCGVRDVRDYRIHTAHHEIITGGSAFNIKAVSLRLGNFSRAETEYLWQQHTDATGQSIDAAIYPELWLDTAGQPWLVNALGLEVSWNDRQARDRSVPITLERYKAARERLIQSRATHLDQLTDKLREPRVHGIVAALLEGETASIDVTTDDQQYVEDLGLITTRPQLCIANRIYQEVIPRELTWIAQTRITHEQPWYLTPERRLDMKKLLSGFQQFFRENSDIWLEKFDYKEAGPQLLLQAFLQRIVNGGGRINREYGLGRRRTDLFLEWPIDEAQGYLGPVQRVVIELKILHQGLETTIKQGLVQTADYADRCGADETHLIIFNRRPKISWNKRIWQRDVVWMERTIGVWGA